MAVIKAKKPMKVLKFFQSLRLLVGAAVVLTLFVTVSQASAKDEQDKQQHQAQKQQRKAEHQQNRESQNANKQSRNDNKQAQHQANQAQNEQRNRAAQNQAQNEQRNRAAQNQAQNEQRNQSARNQARNEERNRAEQNQAALNQAQENNRRNEQANRNAEKARNKDLDRALNQRKNDGNRSNWNDYRKNEHDNNRANNQANERERQAAIKRENERVAAHNRANQRARYQVSRNLNANRPGFRPDKRWDYKLNERQRYQTYKKYRNNWNEQRIYLRSNLSRFNELADLNRQQQELLDSQMRAAYLQYHNNQYNGAYNWNTYSDPQFIDYVQTRNPSLMQRILGFLGLGDNGDYLYSSNWDDERSELSRNMANIHQLALEGRITPAQERQLMEQMKQEFMGYHNNSWDGSVGWSQYSDPGFVDYLNVKKPSILMTVRDYLVR
ncbi:MAG: hypothetical protein C0469_10665 [Cyanobacteria bacterium DS2.3.42]|nr:hypothetical protein [Cyanobacteria bacterium DS2.3.42]